MSTTTNVKTFKINYLTKAQYNTALNNNEIDENQIYLTSDEATGVLIATDDDNGNVTLEYTSSIIDHLSMNQLTIKKGTTDYFVVNPTENKLMVSLDTTATSGTTDGDLYAAITALGWGSEVID